MTKVDENKRTYWLFPYKSSIFDVEACLKEHDSILWHLTSSTENKLKKGDFVFLYDSAPQSSITFLMKVDVPCWEKHVPPYKEDKFWRNKETKKEIKPSCLLKFVDEIDNKNLTYRKIKERDDSFSVQWQHRINGESLNYILNVVYGIIDKHIECNDEQLLTEGKVSKSVSVTHERNLKARQICLKHNGYNCKVCGMDFEKMYGELGKGFIHVHHIVPVSERGGEYEVDPIKDLVPVCPNCHAMLHHKGTISVDDLIKIINK